MNMMIEAMIIKPMEIQLMVDCVQIQKLIEQYKKPL